MLQNKKIIRVNQKLQEQIDLDQNGIKYRSNGLPEKIFLQAIDDDWKGLNIITKKTKLSREEVNACLGLLKKALSL